MSNAPRLAFALMLGSCAVAPPEPMTPRNMQAEQPCINNDHVVGRRGVGAGAVDFEMSNGVIFRNRLQGACPAVERLGPMLAVAIVSGGEGGQLCRGDRIRLFDPIEARSVGISAQPSCVLGGFAQVSHLPNR